MNLTAHEIRVVKLVARGYTNREIAKELFCSADTIGSHIKHCTSKLNTSGRLSLVIAALQKELITLDECKPREGKYTIERVIKN